MENNEFDEMLWIQDYFEGQVSFDSDSIKSIRNFTLLWSMFEDIACNKMATIVAIEEFVGSLNRRLINREKINFFSDFVRERYLDENNELKSNFSNLNFRDNKNDQRAKELVEQVLKREVTDRRLILTAMLFIIYRLRNNLLHGIKGIIRLNIQEEYFSLTNRLLAKCLELHKDSKHMKVSVRNNQI